MRQITIYIDRSDEKKALEIAREHGAEEATQWQVNSQDGQKSIVSVQISNRALGPLLEDLEGLSGLRVSFSPSEVVTVVPPPDVAPESVTDLEPRSPLEIFLHSRQSLDNWGSFLIFSLLGAVVVWIAFFTNSIFLLLAAMLIAPFGEPAMNVAVATALGDRGFFFKNMARYLMAIAVTAIVNGAFAFLIQNDLMNSLMISVSRVSSITFLLPLIAGVAGTLNLVQSDRSQLVSGSGVGIFLAAALAPPAGLLGISIGMGLWNMALSAAFQLALQLVAINLAGSLMFRAYGLNTSLSRYDPGKKVIFYASVAISAIALAGLLYYQYSDSLRLQRSSQQARATQVVRRVVDDSDLAEAVQIEADFPQPEPQGSNKLLITGYIIKNPDVDQSEAEIISRLKQDIALEIREKNPEISVLVDLKIIDTIP